MTLHLPTHAHCAHTPTLTHRLPPHLPSHTHSPSTNPHIPTAPTPTPTHPLPPHLPSRTHCPLHLPLHTHCANTYPHTPTTSTPTLTHLLPLHPTTIYPGTGRGIRSVNTGGRGAAGFVGCTWRGQVVYAQQRQQRTRQRREHSGQREGV